MSEPARKPICLVTGFLGTGKTTLLKRIIAQAGARKLVFLVNEFSPHDVDSAVVSADHPNVISIPGGSIFCKCLVSEFMARLRQTAEQWSDADGVVIEASGVANPMVIKDMLRETQLDGLFRLATVVSVIDPGSWSKLRHTLPNILTQVQAADLVLINKADQYDEQTMAQTEAQIAGLNPTARRVITERCDAGIDLFGQESGRVLHGEYAECRDPNYHSFMTERAFDGEALEQFLREHRDQIYRVKGSIGPEHVDWSTSGMERTAQEWSMPRLVWIVKGGSRLLQHRFLLGATAGALPGL